MNIKKNFTILLLIISLLLTISGASAAINWATDVDFMIYPLNSEVGTITSGGTYPAYDSLEDLSGNVNHGTAYNGVSITGDTSFGFDGTDDYISAGNILLTTVTLSEWIRFDDLLSLQVITRKGYDGTQLPLSILISSGNIRAGFYDGSWHEAVYDISTFNSVDFYHMVFTYDNLNLKLYINGNLVDTLPYTGNIINNNKHILVGVGDNNGVLENYFNGEITSPIIFNKALTQTEISGLYAEEKNYNPYTVPSNTAPTIPTIPSSPITENKYVTDTLTSICSGSTDSVNDTITYYYKFIQDDTITTQDWSTDNDIIISTSESHSLVKVYCKAYDGELYSSELHSKTTTVINTAPTVPTTLVLLPPTIYTNDTLMAYASGSTDTDNDIVSYYYEFINQGSSVIIQAYSSNNSYKLPSGYSSETIIVNTKSYDGYDYSSTELAETTIISNLAPSYPNIGYDSNLAIGNIINFKLENATDLEEDILNYAYQIKINDIIVNAYSNYDNYNMDGTANVYLDGDNKILEFSANISNNLIGKTFNLSVQSADPYQLSEEYSYYGLIGWTIEAINEQNEPILDFSVIYNNITYNTTNGLITLTDETLGSLSIISNGYYLLTIDITSIDSYIIQLESLTPPESLTPYQGNLNSFADITCGNDRTKLYEIQYNIDDEWTTLIINSGKHSFNLLNYNNKNISFRCRSISDGQYSRWLTTENLSINNFNKLNLRNINFNKKLQINKRIIFESYCSVDSNNEKIIASWSDCNNDGQYDYYSLLENKTDNSFLFVCKYDEPNDYQISSGCIIQRMNESINWDTCNINNDDKLCNIQKSLNVEVEI